MRFIADLQLHSKYSRATSKDMVPENMALWAQLKGIYVLGTGDFTHPAWMKELKEKLEPAEPGLYRLKAKYASKSEHGITFNRDRMRFLVTGEISNIYSKNGKVRRVHNLIWLPSLEVAEAINTKLSWIGNLKSDGRPIIGLDSEELTKIVLGVSKDAMVIPAHAWTPYFSVFGSMSGFDSLDECYGAFSKYIYAVETGLSSSPPMNWRLSQLDRVALTSNSDSHSLQRLGREANVLEGDAVDYFKIAEAFKNASPFKLADCSYERTPLKLKETIEFYPEEGKYHYDGHRLCKVRFSPQESKEHKNLCPKCGRALTIGVMNRVEAIADRPLGAKPEKTIPYRSLVSLDEVIAEAFGQGKATKKVFEEYLGLVRQLGSEFFVLLDAARADIERVSSADIAEGVMRVREGRLSIQPGFDGEYGIIKIFEEAERGTFSKQASLF
ncbi:DNA helicase UvrD [Candidatus Parcubacteria bacterium]|nr:DNA helicase UvrD [Candidatus Parcubacteria bacterium]